MTNKEIFLSAMNFKPTPRLPVILLSSGVWECSHGGMSLQDFLGQKPHQIADFILKTNQILNMDIIWTAAGCNNLLLKAIGEDVSFDGVGQPSAINVPLLNKAADIEKIDINAVKNSREINNLLEATGIITKKAGDEYLIGVSQWGPFTLAGLLFGLEKFIRICMKDKIAAEAILNVTSELVTQYFDLFTEAGAELLNLSDPTASCDMISPQMFASLALPPLKKCFWASNGKVSAKMLHICGNTTKIVEIIPETGVDIFSVDFKVDLSVAKAILAGRVALAGNIDPVRLMLERTAKEVAEKAVECARVAAGSGGFILMPGCDIPPTVPLENIHAMVEAAHNCRSADCIRQSAKGFL